MPDDLGARVRARLFEQRVVFLSGRLDETTANRAAIELMTLDASGDEAIHLRIDCGEGGLEPALTLMDVVELAGVPVHVTAHGMVAGPAVGVLAVAAHRLAMPHARFRLCEPEAAFRARARDLEQWAQSALERSHLFCARLAEHLGRPIEHVEADLAAGRFLTAEQAVAYGLIDEIVRPDPGDGRAPGNPMGFRPR